jgi:dGTPase
VAHLPPETEAERAEEKSYLYETLYTCSALEREHAKAEAVVTELFEFWVREPEQLPESYLAEIESEGAARVAADYIAGMTDNFILLQYAEARRYVRSGRSAVRVG